MVLELLAHPFGQTGISSPQRISYVDRKAGRVVHADDERIEPSVSVLYDAGLAVDDDVLVIA
jgi:hypothetical protein